MTYNFNPHRHIKIWLSKNPASFLNLENRARLIKMRATNPTDEINFIYDSSLLSAQALKDLDIFCKKYQIVAKDVQKDVIPNCTTAEEKNLIKSYQDEITNLDTGGNLAVACDLIRWLHPVYELGTYTDFDVPVDTSEVPLTIPVEKPLLVNLGSVAVTRDIESLALNNDTLAVVDGQAASADIKKIQQFLYGASLRRHGSSVFDTHLISHAASLQQFVPPFLVPHLLSIDPNYETLQHLAAIGMGKTAREVRHDIIKATENNTIFSQNILGNGPYSQFLPESEKIRQAAALLRSQVQSQLGWFNWLFLPSAQYQQFKMAASISDDDKFLTIMREKNRMALLKTNVVYTSGPGAVAQSWLGRLFFKREEINERIAPFSFAHYRLDKVFISDNGMPLHASAKEALAKMSGTELGKTNDLSWLEEGQNATVVREKKIQKILENLPRNFEAMRGKVQAHIKKIEVDLEGCFGFYRYRERHAKIRALQGILTHFSDGFFDVDGFQNALNNYRSNDISASLWKSETKTLIDDLVQFCEQAKNYELTNSQGQVSLPVPIPSVGLLV